MAQTTAAVVTTKPFSTGRGGPHLAEEGPRRADVVAHGPERVGGREAPGGGLGEPGPGDEQDRGGRGDRGRRHQAHAGAAEQRHDEVRDERLQDQGTAVRAVDEEPVHADDGGHGHEAERHLGRGSQPVGGRPGRRGGGAHRALRATPGLDRVAAIALFHAGANGESSATRITDADAGALAPVPVPVDAVAADADDADHPEPLPQPGGRRQLVVGRLADDEHEGALAVPLDHVDHRPQAGAAGGLDDRQVLEHRLQVRRARAEARVGAVGGDQAHEVTAGAVGRHDAGRRRHRRLERAAVVRRPPDVEQHGGAPLPRQLVLADQQLVVAGRGRPVDAAQVVAHDVGPQGVEVVAGAAEGVRVLHAGERVVAGGERHRLDLVDLRADGHVDLGRRLDARLHQPERVGHDDLERPDLHDARGGRWAAGTRPPRPHPGRAAGRAARRPRCRTPGRAGAARACPSRAGCGPGARPG